MTILLRFLSPRLLMLVLGLGAVAGGVVYISHIRTSLVETRSQLASAVAERDAAMAAADRLKAQAEELARRERATADELSERIRRIESAQGACLDVGLPPGLLDE
jgi:ubiquinone biosynthesis protein UbiJ